MAEKKQNSLVVVILIIIIIGSVAFNIKRMIGRRSPASQQYTPTPVVSPSGEAKTAALVEQQQITSRGEKKMKKVTMPSINVQLKQLTSGAVYNTQPVFSPDGKEIAFVSLNKNAQNIYILRPNASEEPARLTHGEYMDSHPFWTSDGKKIIFSSNRERRDSELFWVDRFTGEVSSLNKEGGNPSLSSDGEWLAYVDQHNIWIMGLTTKEFTPLTTTGYNDWPVWSKDGKRIYFSNNGFIKVLDRNTSEIKSVVSSSFNDYPAVSPLDNRLAYVSLASGRYDLWMMDVDGNKLQLTGDEARESFPSWAPDGRSIVFASDASGPGHLWLLTLLE